ncbi:MAG: hypothetical protein ABUK01_18075 [Leptospirales bacterium]
MFKKNHKKMRMLLAATVSFSSLFVIVGYVSAGGGTHIQEITCDTRFGWYTKKSYKKEDFERLKTLVQKYGEGGGYTVMYLINRAKKYCKKESDGLMTWAEMDEKGFALSSAVHEETHAFTGSAKYDMLGKHISKRGNTIAFEVPNGGISSFYLDGWGIHHLFRTKYYDSKKMTAILPAKKFKGLRYDTYIVGGEYSVSRQFGIYGLLNEYHAYYHGNKINHGMNEDGVYKDLSNAYTAFPEFTLFILKYMQFAKKRYPAIYKTMMKEKETLETFIRIHDKFEPIFCDLALSKNEFDKSIYNYKNIGETTYKGRSCSVTLKMYETTDTKKTYYTNSKDMENYLIELQTPEMVSMLKEMRQASGVK